MSSIAMYVALLPGPIKLSITYKSVLFVHGEPWNEATTYITVVKLVLIALRIDRLEKWGKSLETLILFLLSSWDFIP